MTLENLLDEIDARWPLKWSGPSNPYTESAIYGGMYWYHYLPSNGWLLVNKYDQNLSTPYYKVRIFKLNIRREPIQLLYHRPEIKYNQLVLRCAINDVVTLWYDDYQKGHHDDNGTYER